MSRKYSKVTKAISEDEEEEDEEEEDEEEYEVERILAFRAYKKSRQYLIKWAGFDEPTWEKASNVVNPSEEFKAQMAIARTEYMQNIDKKEVQGGKRKLGVDETVNYDDAEGELEMNGDDDDGSSSTSKRRNGIANGISSSSSGSRKNDSSSKSKDRSDSDNFEERRNFSNNTKPYADQPESFLNHYDGPVRVQNIRQDPQDQTKLQINMRPEDPNITWNNWISYEDCRYIYPQPLIEFLTKRLRFGKEK